MQIKNRQLLILYAYLFNWAISSAQSEKFPHFTRNSIFRVDEYVYHYLQGMTCKEINVYHRYFKNDTILNGKKYMTVFTSKSLVFENGTPICNILPVFSGYRGGLREDTVLKKVYYIDRSDKIEDLLFDYNLQIGDSIRGSFSGNCKSVVNAIDTVWLGNGEKRKRWHFNCGYFIEGIGSSFGLVEYFSTYMGYSQLVCVKDSATILYESGVSSPMGCVEITSVQETEAEAEQWDVSISPNPSVSGIFNIAPSYSALYTITVYSYLGESIFLSKTIQGKTELNLFEQPSGIYLLQIITAEGGMYYQKLVKE